MSAAKHAPGQWCRDADGYLRDADGKVVRSDLMLGGVGASGETDRAQANDALIIAAPSIAVELQKAATLIESARVLAVHNQNTSSESAFEDGLESIRAALRKAGVLP